MKCEVGSNFWEYNSSSEKECFININGIGKYDGQQLFISGRNAIQALCNILSSSSKTVLLPSYTCNTVIQPFIKAGWNIEYYKIKRDLTIDQENLSRLVEKINPCMIVVHGYFGFNTLEKSRSILEEFRNNGIIIVEDVTQTIFSNFKKIRADYYVSSLRKWFAISDGGLLVSKNGNINIEYEGNKEEIVEIAKDAFDTKAKYMKYQNPILKDEYMKKYSKLKRLIDECDIICPMTKEGQDIISNIDLKEIAFKRKENYNLLLNGLKDNNVLDCIFFDLPKDIVPLYLPVYIRNKNHRKNFQQYLADNNIYCPIIWPKPAEYENNDDSTIYIYEHILCMPCDQRYDEDDMERIIGCINRFKYEVIVPDVYYMDSWGALNAKQDDGIINKFRYESESGVVLYQFVKRPIPTLVNEIQYYDTITPYGFNGPVITKCINQEKLLSEFEVAFTQYCLKNNIVAEYVRFSPWLKNHVYMKNYYNLRYNNQTLFIDLRKDFFNEEFSSKSRNVIRKALKNNIEIQFDFQGVSIEHFIELYNKMVNKHNINAYYRFDKEFIYKTFDYMKGNIFAANALYKGRYISTALFIFDDTHIHYHLSGNDYEYTSLGANSLVLYEVAIWAKKHNIRQFHLGGASHGSLLKFKQSFTKKGMLDYYVGSRIRNNDIYNQLIDICGKNENGFFPEYR